MVVNLWIAALILLALIFVLHSLISKHVAQLYYVIDNLRADREHALDEARQLRVALNPRLGAMLHSAETIAHAGQQTLQKTDNEVAKTAADMMQHFPRWSDVKRKLEREHNTAQAIKDALLQQASKQSDKPESGK